MIKEVVDEKVLQPVMPKGIAMIIGFFLMLAGVQIRDIFSSMVWIFPLDFEAPVTMPSGSKITMQFLLGLILGVLYLFVIYGIYHRFPWSCRLTKVVAVLSASYGVGSAIVAITGVVLHQESDVTVSLAEAYLLVTAIYNVAVATGMIYIFRLLMESSTIKWFSNIGQKE